MQLCDPLLGRVLSRQDIPHAASCPACCQGTPNCARIPVISKHIITYITFAQNWEALCDMATAPLSKTSKTLRFGRLRCCIYSSCNLDLFPCVQNGPLAAPTTQDLQRFAPSRALNISSRPPPRKAQAVLSFWTPPPTSCTHASDLQGPYSAAVSQGADRNSGKASVLSTLPAIAFRQ